MPAFLLDWTNLKSFHILKSFISCTVFLSPFTDMSSPIDGETLKFSECLFIKVLNLILPHKFIIPKYSSSKVQMRRDKKKSLKYLLR